MQARGYAQIDTAGCDYNVRILLPSRTRVTKKVTKSEKVSEAIRFLVVVLVKGVQYYSHKFRGSQKIFLCHEQLRNARSRPTTRVAQVNFRDSTAPAAHDHISKTQ